MSGLVIAVQVAVIIVGVVVVAIAIEAHYAIKRQWRDHEAGDHTYCGPALPCQDESK